MVVKNDCGTAGVDGSHSVLQIAISQSDPWNIRRKSTEGKIMRTTRHSHQVRNSSSSNPKRHLTHREKQLPHSPRDCFATTAPQGHDAAKTRILREASHGSCTLPPIVAALGKAVGIGLAVYAIHSVAKVGADCADIDFSCWTNPPPIDFLLINQCSVDFMNIQAACGGASLAAIACGIPPVSALTCGGVPIATMACIAAVRQGCLSGCISPFSFWCN